MKGSNTGCYPLRAVLFGVALVVVAVGLTGCQVDVGGQTLPSAYHLTDDVQYFPPGSEFKLAREAAAMRQQAPQQGLQP